MNEYENIMSKSTDDLRQIALAFGDFTPEEVGDKTREELIEKITGKTAAEETPAEDKAASEAKEESPKKKGRTSKAKKEEAEETPAPKKRGRKPASAKKEEEVKEEPAPEVKEETPSESTEKEEEKPAPKKKGRKTKEKKEEKKESSEEKEETTAEAAPAAETPAQPIKSKKRRLSFGPDKELTQVEVTPEMIEAEEEEMAKNGFEAPQPAPVEESYREIEGILSIGSEKNDFCGFVHTTNFLPGEDDAYVAGQMIRRYGLRKGDRIRGLVAPIRGKERFAPLRKIISVNGYELPEDGDASFLKKRPRFESLTAIYPNERLTLETEKEDISTRIIDLFCPIGKGQRGMVVSPPKAGKTILLQKIANSITANNPSCKLIVLLIDERPEEVTDMQRSIKGEVVYSTFDKRPENHVKVTELVLEHAMRMVENGEDVVILLDSMTRLARAYNLTINPTGRTLSGGLDPGSLYGPKRFFGAARNIEDGGSLTIIATALIETGSRMDEVIFEEFKGTGNMEVVLDRKLADRRCFPAIAVDKSGTRREDLLIDKYDLDVVWTVRKRIAEVDTVAATSAVIDFMKKTSSNRYFIESARKSFVADD
ncbi:MAG: transcription termination factor Rho [Saccharofermentans sp.]|nr:transcription termination factor Rho [Saccharofermentans sp.]